MSSQEDNGDTSDCPKVDIFKPKTKPKAIRVLTVLAYVLSVSMAAILLSIYYLFMWEGRPHIGARTSKQIGNVSLMQNDSPIERHVLNSNFTEDRQVDVLEKILLDSGFSGNSKDINNRIINTTNDTRNAETNQTPTEPEYPIHYTNYDSVSIADRNNSGEHDLV